jgi:hypothetical protein
MLLHDLQELDDDLGCGSNQDLSLTSLLGVGDGLEGVSKNRGSSHCEICAELSGTCC